MSASLPKLYTSAEAALFLGVKVCTVRNECHRGKLGFITVGGRFIRHTEEHLTEYLKRQEKRPCANTDLNQDSLNATDSASHLSVRAPPTHGAELGIASDSVRHSVSALARQTFARPPKRSRSGSLSGAQAKKPDRAA